MHRDAVTASPSWQNASGSSQHFFITRPRPERLLTFHVWGSPSRNGVGPMGR